MEANAVVQSLQKEGIDELFGKLEESLEETFLNIPISKLKVNSYNARKFSENLKDAVKKGKFNSLCASIRKHGYLQAILVRPIDDGFFMIVAGERRYYAGMRIVKEDNLDPESFTIPSVVRRMDDE